MGSPEPLEKHRIPWIFYYFFGGKGCVGSPESSSPKVLVRHENAPQGATNNTSTHRHKQPANQGNKERHESTNTKQNIRTHKRTNKRTVTHTCTQTNTLTTRPLAANCKHKHKLLRPGARLRCRSGHRSSERTL